jgi:hypothetical protein
VNLCCLTLIFQKDVEEDIIDFMLEHLKQGFHTSSIEGHGHDAELATLKEQVRGRAGKTRMDIVMEESDADTLLADIRNAFPGIRIAFWTSPVNAFGRLP